MPRSLLERKLERVVADVRAVLPPGVAYSAVLRKCAQNSRNRRLRVVVDEYGRNIQSRHCLFSNGDICRSRCIIQDWVPLRIRHTSQRGQIGRIELVRPVSTNIRAARDYKMALRAYVVRACHQRIGNGALNTETVKDEFRRAPGKIGVRIPRGR